MNDNRLLQRMTASAARIVDVIETDPDADRLITSDGGRGGRQVVQVDRHLGRQVKVLWSLIHHDGEFVLQIKNIVKN